MSDFFIYNVNTSEEKSKYLKLYNLVKKEFEERALPASVNPSNLLQFKNINFNNLLEESKINSIIFFKHIHYTVNQLKNAIQGKINTNNPYTDTNLIIKQSDIDNDIEYVNTLAQKHVQKDTNNHGCQAICIGLCVGACYSSCNGCTSCTGIRG